MIFLQIYQEDVQDILTTLMNNGLRETRYKKSKLNIVEPVSKYRTGKIIVTRSKEELKGAKGVIVGSIEALLDNHPNLTHITPNVYRSAKNLSNGGVKGHSERNLKQINAFIIDIDGVDKSVITLADIVLRGHEVGLRPTLVLHTPKGYHVYFMLKEPIYIKKTSGHNNALDKAKRISLNLRKYYAEVIPGIDVTCNHFGFFRCPNKDNIIDYSPEFRYSMSDFINFSIKYESLNMNESQKHFNNNIIPFKQLKNIHEPWFHLLYNCKHIKGHGEQIGRDNAIFTMALHMYASKLSRAEAIEMLAHFNKNLKYPLEHSIVVQKVNSAYSGKYKGASKLYIYKLLYAWCEITEKIKNRLFFRNHAKARKDRLRSHYSEWKEDLYQYIKSKETNGYLEITTKELCEALGIPKSTLKEVLKKYDTFIWSATKGKYAKLKITTKDIIINNLLKKIKTNNMNIQRLRVELYKFLSGINLSSIEKTNILRNIQLDSNEKLETASRENTS
ncbi:primase C-terminal domain-containing protein [Staphylococcus aureus]|uniref:primase C-terminal domain-containing protein n=1 Tax=Staphylococcus aureus TaxID=1280 RepID=UPI00333EC6FA